MIDYLAALRFSQAVGYSLDHNRRRFQSEPRGSSMQQQDRWVLVGLWIGYLVPSVVLAAEPGQLTWPPKLPGGRTVAATGMRLS